MACMDVWRHFPVCNDVYQLHLFSGGILLTWEGFLPSSSWPQSTGFGIWLFLVSSLRWTNSGTKWDVLFLVSVYRWTTKNKKGCLSQHHCTLAKYLHCNLWWIINESTMCHDLIFKNTLRVTLPWFPHLFLKRRQAAEIGRCRVWTRYFLSQWLQLKFLHEEWCPSFQAVKTTLDGGCSCTSTVWRAVWILELCLPPGLALQAGISSLLPPLWTGINEMVSLAWVAPPKEDGGGLGQPWPQVRPTGAVLRDLLIAVMEAELGMCPAQSDSSEGITDTSSLTCAE